MVAAARYTRTAMVLHWLVAVLIVVNVLLGLFADDLPDSVVRRAIDTHKSIGITVLGLALLRLLWRLAHRPPPLPASYARRERGLAHGAHIALYALIFALPISGWIHDSAYKNAAATPLLLFGVIPWPRLGWIMAMPPAQKAAFHSQWFAIHVWLGYALYALVALHVLGALKHQLFDRDKALARMLPGI